MGNASHKASKTSNATRVDFNLPFTGQGKMKSDESKVYAKVRICQKCNRIAATHVRKFDLEKVPQRYIMNPKHIDYNFIIGEYKVYGYNGWMSECQYLVDLPKEHILTKYNYYLCSDCYEQYGTPTCEWNHWELY